MKREASLRALVLRAVIVTLAVLLCLILLRHFGILAEQLDAPAPDAVAVSSQEDPNHS